VLETGLAAVDADAFEQLVDEATDSRDAVAASGLLDRALALQRGRPLVEFEHLEWARPEVARLEALQFRAIEARGAIALELGRHAALVPELEALVAVHPLRERLWAQLMLALYRDGRPADALDAFRRVHGLLAEVGLEVSPELAELEATILRHGPTVHRAAAADTHPRDSPTPASVPRPLPSPLAVSDAVPFVGRLRELATLERARGHAAGGRRRVVLVAGEPGAGKSRLAAESAADAHRGGATVLYGRCDEELGVSYQPFIQALGPLARVGGDDLHPLDRYAEAHDGTLTPLLAETAHGAAGPAPKPAPQPEVAQLRMFDAVVRCLADASTDHLVVLVLDDLHWATKPTLLLLSHILRSDAMTQLLVIGTYRDTAPEVGRHLVQFLGDLGREQGVERIRMTGLSRPDVAAFIDGALGSVAGSGELRLASRVHTATGGNPLFVGEVLRHMMETGALQQRGGRWQVARQHPELGVPLAVRDVVALRLAKLGDDAKRLILSASVLGSEFDLSVLELMIDFDEDRLEPALDEVLRARLIESIGGWRLRHRFCHELVRAAVHDDLSDLRRARLHRDAAQAIEATYRSRIDEHLAALAHHYTQAAAVGEVDNAVRYCARAGRRALVRGAADEAIELCGRALSLFDSQSSPDELQRCDTLIDLGEAQRAVGDERQRETFLTAAGLARDLGDMRRLARAGQAFSRGFLTVSGGIDPDRIAILEAALQAAGEEETPSRARVLASLAGEVVFSGDRRRSALLSEEAVAVARRVGDPSTLAKVLATRSDVIWHPGTLEERRQLAAETADIGRSLGDAATRWRAATMACSVALESGDLRGFEEQLDLARTLANGLASRALIWSTDLIRTTGALVAGSLDVAEGLVLAGADFGATGSNSFEKGVALGAQLFQIRLLQGRLAELESAVSALGDLPAVLAASALVQCELGRFAEGREIFDRLSERHFAALRHDTTWPFAVATCVEVNSRVGDARRASDLHRLLAPYRAQFIAHDAYWVGSTAHHLGLLAASLDRLDEAIDHFAYAADAHRQLPAPAHLARTQAEWARALTARGADGDVERAEDLRRQSRATALRLGLGLGLASGAAPLRDLSLSVSSDRSDPGPSVGHIG
jgi:tetratricopeptide (TPR) repeat protein